MILNGKNVVEWLEDAMESELAAEVRYYFEVIFKQFLIFYFCKIWLWFTLFEKSVHSLVAKLLLRLLPIIFSFDIFCSRRLF